MSAGARLTVMRLAGSARPEAISAERTRSRDSATALSARPTTVHLHVDRPGLDALEGHRRHARHHVRPPPGLVNYGTFAEQRPERKGANWLRPPRAVDSTSARVDRQPMQIKDA